MSASISRILTTSNPDSFQIELEQQVTTRSLSGTYLNVRNQTLRFWLGLDKEALQGIVKDFSVKFDSERGKNVLANISGIQIKDILGSEAHLSIVETVEPRRTSDGTILSNPKLNPATQEVLCVDDQPIYRETVLNTEPVASTFLAHNSVMSVDDYNALYADQRLRPFQAISVSLTELAQ